MRIAGVAVVVITLSVAAARVQDAPLSPELIAIAQAALRAQQAGDLVQAEAGYRKFLESEPRNVEVLGNLGVVYAGLGRYDDAIASYRRALGIAHLNLPIRMNLVLAFYKAGRCREALDELDVVFESSPDAPAALLVSADCHLQLGEPAKAVEQLKPVAADHADNDAFSYVMGMALLRSGQPEDGAVYLDRILKKGDSAEARLMLGMAQRAAADYTGARDEFAKAVALNPQLPMAHSLYGQALLATGDREAARAAFLKELAINPTDFESNLYLGVIFKEEQDHGEARRYFDKALTLRPDDPGAQYQQATLMLATGENDRARETLERLVAENPGFTEAHVSLATVYYRLKRKPDGDRHRAIAETLTAEAQARQPGAKARPEQ